MNSSISIMSWQGIDLLIAAAFIFIILTSLGFSLLKALSETDTTPYWHLASILMIVGSIITGLSCAFEVFPLVLYSAYGLIALGIVATFAGVFHDMVHRFYLYRDHAHHHA